jgi:hypothetical protein
MSETDLQRLIQVDAVDLTDRLWRMNVGNFELKDGRRIVVGTPGMSDLIGFTSTIVTPDMVGQRIAIFTAVEVKTRGGRTDPDRLRKQNLFIGIVQQLGGRAGFATSVEEARAILHPEEPRD